MLYVKAVERVLQPLCPVMADFHFHFHDVQGSDCLDNSLIPTRINLHVIVPFI